MEKNKLWIILGGLFVLVFIVGALVIGGKKSAKQTATDSLPQEAIIPTIDSSVNVELKPTAKKGEATLTVQNAPSGTSGIEYTITYDALNADTGEGGAGVVPQGVTGKCERSGSLWQCGEPSLIGKKIVFGTCSSGVCRYHQIQGNVKVSLKFNGSYGDKIFEKDYVI